MERNFVTEAAVLKNRRFGDNHKIVMLLSPEYGIIEAVAHGAYKGRSRLSSITDPFCVSNFELYHNPVKDNWKINACESVKLNDNIRANINALYNAYLWAEIIIKSHASGADFLNIYNLYTDALSALNDDNTSAMILTAQFIYRFLTNSGFISGFSECGHCERQLSGESIFYSQNEGCFLCADCSSFGLPVIEASTVVYLEETLEDKLAEAVKKRLELGAANSIRNTMVMIIKSIIESPLKTLDYIDYGME